MAKYAGVEFKIHPANGKQGHAALTNEKHDNFDQIQADNII
jgi:hypothetical protein